MEDKAIRCIRLGLIVRLGRDNFFFFFKEEFTKIFDRTMNLSKHIIDKEHVEFILVGIWRMENNINC